MHCKKTFYESNMLNCMVNVLLFVNLIRVNVHYPRALSSRFSYKALKTQALRLKNDGVPVYGLGLQGHFSSHNIDIDVLKVIDLH